MISLLHLLNGEIATAIIRGLVIAGLILILYLLLSLDRYLRSGTATLQVKLDLLQTRMSPDNRVREFEEAVRRTMREQDFRIIDHDSSG